MAVADRCGFPIAILTESASRHEVKLVADTVNARFTQEQPERLVGDRAYDSDPLDASLQEQGIETSSPRLV